MNNLKTNEQFENFISKLPYGNNNAGGSNLLVVNVLPPDENDDPEILAKLDKTDEEITNALLTTGAVMRCNNVVIGNNEVNFILPIFKINNIFSTPPVLTHIYDFITDPELSSFPVHIRGNI